MRIGIVLPNWIGDVVMATPALRALRRQFPKAHLVGIMRPYVRDVLAGTAWLDESLICDTKQRPRVLQLWRVAQEVRARNLDQLLLLTNSFSSGLMGWLSGTRERIGFAGQGRGWLLTQKLYLPHERGRVIPRSAIEHYLAIAAKAGAVTNDRRIELSSTDEETMTAAQVWRELSLHQYQRVVVLNTGGAFGAAKTWPAEHFALLAKRIVERFDAGVLVICGPAERKPAQEIVRLAADERVVSLADRPSSIALSKGCIASADLVISTDSGPRHIASALDVPTISLFGPTDPRWSENYRDDALMLSEPVPCGPCGQRVCPLKHHRCMVDLTVDRVFAAVEAQLSRFTSRAA